MKKCFGFVLVLAMLAFMLAFVGCTAQPQSNNGNIVSVSSDVKKNTLSERVDFLEADSNWGHRANIDEDYQTPAPGEWQKRVKNKKVRLVSIRQEILDDKDLGVDQRHALLVRVDTMMDKIDRAIEYFGIK